MIKIIKRKTLTWCLLCIGIALALASEEYFRWVRPFRDRVRQIENAANFQTFKSVLEHYYAENGEYPPRIDDALRELGWYSGRDSWGNPVLYSSDGQIYILVSLGRDGLPDGTNYLMARQEVRLVDSERTCVDFDADQILTDRGWVRACGK